MPLLVPSNLSRLGTHTARSARHGARLVWQGIVEIGHNSLAVLGLVSIGAVLFFSSDSTLRQEIERQAMDWLHLRHGIKVTSEDEPVDLLAELQEPAAVARATAAHVSSLTKQQAWVTQWISRRYRVAPEPVARLVQEAWVVGKKAHLEPTLILAIMAIESSFNPFAQSPVGAQGLMQVMTSVHDEKYTSFGGKLAAFDPLANLRVGVQVLTECIARAGSLEAGLKHYVGAANLPDDGGYADRVMVEFGYLKAVSEGQTVAVTVPSVRPAASPAAPAAPTGTVVAHGSPSAPTVAAPPPAHVSTAAAAVNTGSVTKPMPTAQGGAVMAPALGIPLSVNLSTTSGAASNQAPSPAAAASATRPQGTAGPERTPAQAATTAAAAAGIPTGSSTAAPATAPAIATPAVTPPQPATTRPTSTVPTAAPAADAETRPAPKAKVETAAASQAPVAMLGGAVR